MPARGSCRTRRYASFATVMQVSGTFVPVTGRTPDGTIQVSGHVTGLARFAMNRVLSVFVGAVVLLAVVAGMVVAKRAAPELDSHTPEGVVQQYLQAVIAGDYQVAAAA
jgi:hypothetical protein